MVITLDVLKAMWQTGNTFEPVVEAMLSEATPWIRCFRILEEQTKRFAFAHETAENFRFTPQGGGE